MGFFHYLKSFVQLLDIHGIEYLRVMISGKNINKSQYNMEGKTNKQHLLSSVKKSSKLKKKTIIVGLLTKIESNNYKLNKLQTF